MNKDTPFGGSGTTAGGGFVKLIIIDRFQSVAVFFVVFFLILEESVSLESICSMLNDVVGFPGGSVVENPPASAGDAGLIPGLG